MHLLHSRSPEDQRLPPKNPFQVFMLGLSILASAPLLVGQSGSAALERNVSDVAVESWGWCLLLGSVAALVGMWLPSMATSPSSRRPYWGLVIERSGLILVAGAAALYSIVIIKQAPTFGDVRYAACIQVAYAAACTWRVAQISRALHWRSAPPVAKE